jgi:hypothetical protein
MTSWPSTSKSLQSFLPAQNGTSLNFEEVMKALPKQQQQ